MMKWELFETQCTNYLNEKFGKFATFTHVGGSNSTTSDILVETSSGSRFYIDVKFCPAQCGQFVLLPDYETEKFEYSPKNINSCNKYTEEIMSHMYKNFDTFCNAGTAGETISMPNDQEIFSKWIIRTYKEKLIQFIITNNFIIVPINELSNYFNITAKFRIKKSGSRSIGKLQIDIVKQFIINNDFHIISTTVNGDKLFVKSTENLSNQKFSYLGTDFLFSSKDIGYEVRKLSSTKNLNVIFSIKLIKHTGMSDIDFISYLK